MRNFDSPVAIAPQQAGQYHRISGTVYVIDGHDEWPLPARLRTATSESPVFALGRWLWMAARQTATARGRVPDRALAGQFPLPTQSSRSSLERPKAATVGAQIAGSGRGQTSRCPPSLLGFRAHQCDYLGPDIVQLGGGHLPFALGLAGHPIEALDLVG